MNSIEAIKQANDNVNHPQHYNQYGMETIDIIENSMTKEQFKGYLKGNVIKYITRFEYKNGVVYKDDGMICKLTAEKRYSVNPRIEIEIREESE